MLAEELFMLVFTVSMHQAIEVLDQTVMAVALVRKEEEIYMFLTFSLCYSYRVDPVFRVVSEYINRNPILPLEFRHIL